MSNYLTSILQEQDLWHCTLIDDPDWIDPEDGSIAPKICQQPHESIPSNVIKTGEQGGKNIYLSVEKLDQGDLIGGWDNAGNMLDAVDPIYDVLVPVGNDAGISTGDISYHGYQGHNIRHRQESVGQFEYPADNQAFKLRITRTLTTDDSWPHIPWGWLVEMLSEDPERDITARAIGVYDEAGAYLYTTGAFVLMDFEDGGFDEEGNPIITQRYATVCPVGQRTAEAEPVHFKLLLGSAPEGAWVLKDLNEGATQTRNFWQGDKPVTGNEEWVTITAVTNGMAGTVVLTIPDNSEIEVGSQVRIDGVESVVTSLWNTEGINLDPYQSYDASLSIEVWR